ncbi:MAG: FG-GAP repeat domain-containing protein [Planctomycetota bacterium]
MQCSRTRDLLLFRYFIIIFATVIFTVKTGRAQEIFEASLFPTQIVPETLAAGDFNHDGRIDFAVGNANNGPAAIILANAGGGYNSPVVMPSFLAYFIVAADFNNDGNLDIAGARRSGTLEIVSALGDGAGNFSATITLWTAFSIPKSLDATDVSGDGALDIIATIPGQNSIAICAGDGAGGFVLSQLTGAGSYPSEAAIGDLNHDGIQDIVVSNQFSGIQSFPAATVGSTPYIPGTTITVLLGMGGGSFAAPTAFTVELGPDDVALVDTNGDGYLDVITANDYLGFSSTYSSKNNQYSIEHLQNKKISIALNDTTGAFPAFQALACPNAPRRIVTTDLNQDGIPDLVIPTTVDVFAAQMSALLRSFGDGLGSFSIPSPITNVDCRNALVADLNGDGRPDIVISDINLSTFSILYNNAAGITELETHINSIGNDPRRVAAGDLNGDGYPDVVTANATNCSASILLGSAAGTFTQVAPISVSNNTFCDVALSDVDGDGKLDCLLGSLISGKTYIYKGNGNATFNLNQIVMVPWGGPAQMEAIAAGDLNGDGKPDLALGINALLIYTNNGSGLLNYFSTLDYTGFPKDLEISDMNRDGIADLISSVVAIHFGTGGGNFATPVVFPTLVTENVAAISVADINNDDNPDFLAASIDANPNNTGKVYAGIGDGTGLFTIATPVNSIAATFLATGDADRNATVDIIFGNDFTNFVRVRLGDGAGNFSTSPSLTVKSVRHAVARDFDTDGKLDCAFIRSTNLQFGTGGTGPGIFTILRNVLRTPQNSYYYGSGTAGCRGMMGNSANGTPNIGNNTFAIYGTNAPSRGLGVGLVGDVPFAVGTDIFGYQFDVLVDPYNSTEFAGYDILSTDAGTTYTPFPIPNAAPLVGLIFYIQQIFVESAANGETCSSGAFELVSSRGLSVQIY